MNTFILDQILKTSALLLVAAALVPIIARRSAARARLVWASTFVALLMLPFTVLVSPRWEYRNQTRPPVHIDPFVEPNIVRVEVPDSAAPEITAIPATPPVSTKSVRPWMWPSVWTCFFWGWVAGAALLLLRRMGAAFRLSYFQRRLARVDSPHVLAMTREILGQRAGILRVSDEISVPLTWGAWNPVIVLPSDAAEWPESRLRAALLHEWAHVRGADCGLRLIASIGCALHWPKPLVWLSARSLRAAQEQACDDFALAAGVEPQDYARQLVAAARAIRQCPTGALAMAQPSTLGIRVRAVCDPDRDRRAAGWRARMFVVSAMCTVVAASTLAAPGGDKAALPPIEPSPGSQVTISSHFIEVSPEQMRGLFPNMKAPGLLGVVPDAEAAGLLERIKALGDQTAVAKKATEPEMWELFDPKSGRADFLTSPRVTTKAGQQAIIEIIREVRYEVEDRTFEFTNRGVTLQVEPQGFTDFTMLDIGCSLVELKPEPAGQKITRDSFYRVGWKDPKLQLPRRQTLIVGGWDTIRKGRQLLVFVHASSQVSTLSDIAQNTQVPALTFTNMPISEVARKLAEYVPARPPASNNFVEPANREAIFALLGVKTVFTTVERNPISFQPEAGQPEPRVTLKLPAGSLADALRRVAQNAALSIFAGEPDGRFVFAAPPPSDISERAALIVLPGIRTKGRSLQTVVTEICDEGILQDVFRFRAPVWLGNLPPLVKAMPVVIEAKNITLRDALYLAAKAAGAELSVDETSFHIHPPGKAPQGTALVSGAPGAVARGATDAEVANVGVSLQVQSAELTVEQFMKIPELKIASRMLGLEPAPNAPANAPTAGGPISIVGEGKAYLAGLKTAGIPIVSPAAFKALEGKQTTIRVRKLIRPDGITEFTDVHITPQIGPDGMAIDLNIGPVSGEEKDGQPVKATRRITTNITVFSGASIVTVHRLDPASGKITVLIITPSLP